MKLDENVVVALVTSAQEKFGGAEALQAIDRDLKNIASAVHEAAELDVEREVFVAASDQMVIKMMTVNDITGKVDAYRKEKLTIKVNWPKTLALVGGAVVSLASATFTVLGFIGVGVFLFQLIKDAGVELTTTEALVFAAVFDNRNENFIVQEERLLPLCSEIAAKDGMTAPTELQIISAIDQLSQLGIISVTNGEIQLLDDWVIHGKWR